MSRSRGRTGDFPAASRNDGGDVRERDRRDYPETGRAALLFARFALPQARLRPPSIARDCGLPVGPPFRRGSGDQVHGEQFPGDRDATKGSSARAGSKVHACRQAPGIEVAEDERHRARRFVNRVGAGSRARPVAAVGADPFGGRPAAEVPGMKVDAFSFDKFDFANPGLPCRTSIRTFLFGNAHVCADASD